MARRGREAALKRAREKNRQDKQEAKREKRLAREAEEVVDQPVDEEALMEEFAQLSESHEANRISTARYTTERRRIFGELGIEPDDS